MGDDVASGVDGSGGDEDLPGSVGIALRVILAVGALVVGFGWVLRLATDGPSLFSGLLFELLGPALVMYLGVRYLRTQVAHLKTHRSAGSEES